MCNIETKERNVLMDAFAASQIGRRWERKDRGITSFKNHMLRNLVQYCVELSPKLFIHPKGYCVWTQTFHPRRLCLRKYLFHKMVKRRFPVFFFVVFFTFKQTNKKQHKNHLCNCQWWFEKPFLGFLHVSTGVFDLSPFAMNSKVFEVVKYSCFQPNL